MSPHLALLAASGMNDRLTEALKALAMPTMPSIEDVHALLATGALSASQTVTSGNTFAMSGGNAAVVRIPDAA